MKKWGDLCAVRKLILTKGHGLNKKMIASSLTFEPTGKGVGILFQGHRLLSCALSMEQRGLD